MWEAAPAFCLQEDGPLLACACMTTHLRAPGAFSASWRHHGPSILEWGASGLLAGFAQVVVGVVWLWRPLRTHHWGCAHPSILPGPPSRPPWSHVRGRYSLLSPWPGGGAVASALVALGPSPSRWDSMLRGSDTRTRGDTRGACRIRGGWSPASPASTVLPLGTHLLVPPAG